MLLFTGAMDYYANVDGVKWFCDNIYPEIQINFPNTEFHIVGSNPNANVKALQNNNGVKVTGFVENTRLFYEKAYICVIPLRMARGIQNKVLEAMSMEKAVITTSQAIQGITAVNGEHLVVADEPKEFAQSVVTLLKDKDRRFTLGKNARRFVKTNYNWQTNMEKLEELLNTSS
jgi:glycosyltransferase involved in cell wall biosynthesis